MAVWQRYTRVQGAYIQLYFRVCTYGCTCVPMYLCASVRMYVYTYVRVVLHVYACVWGGMRARVFIFISVIPNRQFWTGECVQTFRGRNDDIGSDINAVQFFPDGNAFGEYPSSCSFHGQSPRAHAPTYSYTPLRPLPQTPRRSPECDDPLLLTCSHSHVAVLRQLGSRQMFWM